MAVSIIIPTYNEEKYIRKCIISLIDQKFDHPYEIIIVDGNSTDRTLSIINDLAKDYKFIKIFMNPKKNAASGRNIGIKQSQYDILAFIDADAYAPSLWISQLIDDLPNCNDNNTAGTGGPDLSPQDLSPKQRSIIDSLYSPLANAGILNPSSQHARPGKLKTVKHIPSCNLAIKKEIFLKYGLFDESIAKAEDLEFSFRLNKHKLGFVYNPNNFVFHHKKDTVQSLYKQNFKWSAGKIEVMRKHGPVAIYIAPVFMAYIILGFIILKPTAAIPLASFYMTITFLESLRINRNRLSFIHLTLISIIAIHLAYFLGFNHGLLLELKNLLMLNTQKTHKKA